MSGLVDQIKNAAAELAKPVSAENPVGTDASFEPAFEALKSELDKISNVSGGIVDWKLVGQGARELSKTLSKDVRVLVWLVVAQFKTEGPKGLAHGLSACQQVCSQYWDAMYPPVKRAKARANQFEWLFEQLDRDVAELKVGAGDKEALELASDLAKELDVLVSEKLGDIYTAVPRTAALLRQRASEVAVAVPPPVAAPAASAPAASPAPVAQPSAPTNIPAPEPMNGAQGATNALRSAATTIKAAAIELRRDNTARPMAYSLPRIATWLLAERLPPVADGQRTAIAPPRDKARLETMAANEKWAELLTAAEELSASSVFWLDPHRFSALALERLGPTHSDAKRALEREVSHFVARLPGITSLQFSDGSPFADANCVAWLDGLSANQGGGGGGGKHQQLSEEEEELKARYEAARELVATGKIDEGLELAHALSCRAPDARSRFRARLEVATLATRGNKPTLACAILDALVLEGDQHRLDAWEPELTAQVYASLLMARRAAGAGALPSGASDDELMARLCRLAPAQALRVSGR